MLTIVILAAHVVISVLMIVLILMHRGTGGGLSDMFGGGMAHLQGSAMVERNLDRLTVITAVLFVLTSVILGLRL